MTEISSLVVLEATSPKSVSLGQSQGVSRAVFPLEALGKDLTPSFSSWDCWCPWPLAYSHTTPVLPPWPYHLLLSESTLSLPSSYKDTCDCIRGPSAKDNLHLIILSLIVPGQSLFPLK